MRPRVREVIIHILSRYGTILGLVCMLLIFSILRPNHFPTINNLLTILKQGAVLAVMAMGLTVVLVLLDFDLSIGALGSFVGVITTGLMARNAIPIHIAIPIGLLLGASVGLVNGLIVTFLGVSSLIATLAMGTILVGATFLYTGGSAIRANLPSSIFVLGGQSTAGIPNAVLVMLAFGVILWVVMHHTETGRQMYAIGGNVEAARLSGVNVQRQRVIGFTFCGLGAGLAGILMASLLRIGHPQACDGLLLDAFTASFLGAVTLREGEFHVGGTLIGVIILYVVLNGLTMVGAEFYLQNIIKGVILIVAVAASGLGRKMRF